MGCLFEGHSLIYLKDITLWVVYQGEGHSHTCKSERPFAMDCSPGKVSFTYLAGNINLFGDTLDCPLLSSYVFSCASILSRILCVLSYTLNKNHFFKQYCSSYDNTPLWRLSSCKYIAKSWQMTLNIMWNYIFV